MKINQKFAKRAMSGILLTVGVIGLNSFFNEAQAKFENCFEYEDCIHSDGKNYGSCLPCDGGNCTTSIPCNNH